MIVCHCEWVASAAVEAAIGAGAGSVTEVTERCGAGGDCGSCWSTIEALLGRCGPSRLALGAELGRKLYVSAA